VSMKLKIITWNVRVLNDKEKRLRVRNLIKLWGTDVICLQETKLDLITSGIICSLWGSQHVDWLYCGSDGSFRWGCGDVGYKSCRED
jgi:hypothetical protein